MRVCDLSCNYLVDPQGVETLHPRLSWRIASSARGVRQTAYRLLVASSSEALTGNTGDLWDSGVVASAQSVQLRYAGQQLKSRQGCHWKVQVMIVDAAGQQAEAWSEPAVWEMGLLRERDWSAKWIAGKKSHPSRTTVDPAPMLRRAFTLTGPVSSARLYISGLGYYEAYFNGQKAGDEVLAPGVTMYDKSAHYQTLDVTSLVREGDNVLGVLLGNGWYNASTEFVCNYSEAPWRDQAKLLAQLEIRYRDGSTDIVVSDRSWRIGSGPIVFDALRNGEFYDARLEQDGWAAPGFNDSDWTPAVIVPGPGGFLRSQQHTPIHVTQTLRPVSVREVKPGVWVYDLGQNISGWGRLKVSGPAGTEVTLRYAEKLTPDDDLDQSNINMFIKTGECQMDRYTLKGQAIEVWEPRFTYHGFQYVQVTGFPGTPTLDNLEGRVVHTAFATCGEFSCSNDLLNRIQACARWSTLGNYHGFPTDCPQREKNGWTGDASISAEQVLLNFDPMTAYHKWLGDLRDAQRPSGQLPGIVPTGGWGYNWGSGPAWDSASILIPWYLYLYEGDTAILETHYASMKRYLDYTLTMTTDYTADYGLGDWAAPNTESEKPGCPNTVTDTAYCFVHADVLRQTAERLGKKADARRFAGLARKFRRAFRKHFVDFKKADVTGSNQTAVACALYQGLLEEAEKPAFLATLAQHVEERRRHIDCGILGAKYVLHALSDLGRADLAFAIATQEDFPGWGHWIRQGATTLWEGWDGSGSRNHHMFSDISAWFYRGLAGINPDPAHPGFKNTIIRPNPVERLDWVNAWHESPYGRIDVAWRHSGPQFALEVTVPANSTATVELPVGVDAVTVDGRPAADVPGITNCGVRKGRRVFQVISGNYQFTGTANTGKS